MDMTIFVLGSATALCTAGFVGWLLELAGWEDKKMSQWAEGKPKERSLLHRYGGWLFFPMIILVGESNHVSSSEVLGYLIQFSTIGLIIAGPYLLIGMLMIYEIIKGGMLMIYGIIKGWRLPSFKGRSGSDQDKGKES
jgi:hypothetical protein